MMPSRFADRVFVPSLRIHGADAPPQACDLRCAGHEQFRPDQHVVSWCGHGHEFITVPDAAGMWWLVPILGEAMYESAALTTAKGLSTRRPFASVSRVRWA